MTSGELSPYPWGLRVARIWAASLVVGCTPHTDPPVEQAPPVASAPTEAPPAELPYTLTSRQIRDVVEPLVPDLDECAESLPHFRNIDVKVKLTIAGSTGEVTSAESVESKRGEAVGRCVAAKLRDARFPRFQKSSQGVSYPLTLRSSK